VAALAGDIEKHLAGLPISARDDTWRYRAGKFVRRHRAAVIAASLAMAALAGGSVATVWEARVAEQERERAERRFTEVRRIANSLLFDVHDALRDVNGAGPAREMVIARALSFFDSLARDAAGDLPLERELGAAYERAGDVQMQANDARGAVSSYLRAVRLREKMASEEPADAGARRDLISTWSKLSDAAWSAGDVAAAIRYSARALALSRDSARTAGAQKSDRIRLATNDLDYGYKLATLSAQRPRGIASCREAVRLFQELVRERDTDARVLRIAAAAYERTAEVLQADEAAKGEATLLRRMAADLRARLAD
jgi:non-specific serine/threonine protein kinase/serine/threonine-protein kinase